jgi:GntR family transcriptional regulator, carbon starvation induced regulator
MTAVPSSGKDDTGSLTYSTYRQLRGDILFGRLPPGEKLKIQDLAERMGVSPSLVREALSRLTAENLVIATPQRGFRVTPITAEDVQDLTSARIEIEMVCLRRSMERGDVSWEANILAALHQLVRTHPEPGRVNERVADVHAQFHRALVQACDSKWLLQMREQLFVQAERYRWINLRMSPENRDLRDEHSEIAKAAIARDIATTSALMENHLRLTETMTLQALASERFGKEAATGNLRERDHKIAA